MGSNLTMRVPMSLIKVGVSCHTIFQVSHFGYPSAPADSLHNNEAVMRQADPHMSRLWQGCG